MPDLNYAYGVDPRTGKATYYHYLIEDVRMPLFVLAVFYTGLFFVLNDARDRSTKQPQIQQKVGRPKFRPPTPDVPPRKLSPEEQAEYARWLAEEDANWDAQAYHDPWEGRP
jgi:hypothetical protein